MECWALNIRIRAHTALSRASCASSCVRKSVPLEDAIRKFSALPAQRLRLTDRGVLKSGMWADIVMFDPETSGTSRRLKSPTSYPTECDTCW